MMSNLINVDFDEMSLEEMQAVQNQLMQKQMGLIIQRQKEIQDELKKAQAEIVAVKEEAKEQLEIAKNSMRVNSPRYDWVNQRDFGSFLEPSVGSKTLGKLLKVVGLAMKSSSRTTPFRKTCRRKIATLELELEKNIQLQIGTMKDVWTL